MMTVGMNNKNKFLTNIANKLGRTSIKTDAVKREWKNNPQHKLLENATDDELVEILKKQCEIINTEVEEVELNELSSVLRSVINKYAGNSLVLWDDPRNKEYRIDESSFLTQLKEEGIHTHIWNFESGVHNREIAEQADIGITFSDITLAESATVVLKSSNGKGRSVSLLPTSYIAIIPKSSIVPRLTQAAEAIYDEYQTEKKLPSCINFISGPSNSGDIEMNLVVGVHGPIQVTYIIVTDK